MRRPEMCSSTIGRSSASYGPMLEADGSLMSAQPIRIARWRSWGFEMETFTLVVVFWLADAPFSASRQEARTPGLSEDECKAAAKLVQPPHGRAHCVLEGRPEPAWSPRPWRFRYECAE